MECLNWGPLCQKIVNDSLSVFGALRIDHKASHKVMVRPSHIDKEDPHGQGKAVSNTTNGLDILGGAGLLISVCRTCHTSGGTYR